MAIDEGSHSDSRVRYLVGLVGLVVVILAVLAVWPSAPAPARLTAGGGAWTRPTPPPMPDAGAGAGAWAGTERPDVDAGGPGAASTPAAPVDLANLTVDALASSSGFGGNPGLPGGAPRTPEVPQDLGALIKAMGDYEAAGDKAALLAIALDGRAASPARAMALHALRKFGSSPEVLDGLRGLVKDGAADFRIRELAMTSLVHIDGDAFQRFFESEALALARSTLPDKALTELVLLAAYLDVTRYGGRSVRALWSALAPLGGTSRVADAVGSFRLRQKGLVPEAPEAERCERSDDPVVLSNYVENLRGRLPADAGAAKKLAEWAAYHRLPGVRKLAAAALRP